jgi:hypothetical protein
MSFFRRIPGMPRSGRLGISPVRETLPQAKNERSRGGEILSGAHS